MDAALRIVVFVGLVGLAFIPLEHRFGRAHGPRRGWLTDLGFATAGEGLVMLGLAGVLGPLFAALDQIEWGRPLLAGIADPTLRTVAEIGVGLLLFELVGYAYHRAAHRVPWLWRLHRVHHSAERMDWLASFRQHPAETVLVTTLQNLPLFILGIPLGAHALVLLLLRINTVFVHANIEIPRGPWTSVIATPRFHHRHHQRDGRAVNFSAAFPWIDRALGTYDDAEAGEFGVREPAPERLVGLLWWPLSGATARRPAPAQPSSSVD